MFSIFKKKNPLVTDLSWLGVDIHSHLLPGIDDGAKDIEESISYIKNLHDLGFYKLICTPHIFTELYPNTRETIVPAAEKVQSALAVENVNVKIEYAAEYMIDDVFKVEKGLMTLPGDYILVEMSYLSENPNIEAIVFGLQIEGYKVILAHPERYNFYHKNLHRFSRLKEMGCLFQINLLSTVGYYGKNVKIAYEYLLKHKLYDFAGTDLHHEKHLSILKTTVQNGEMFKLIGDYPFKNLEIFG